MSRVCQLTGKRTKSGNNRPFSLKATKRTFRPNLFNKRVFNPLTGRVEKMRLSARAIKTLKKWMAEAGAFDEAVVTENTPKTTNEEKGRVHKTKLTPKQKKELEAQKEAEAKEAAKTKVEKEMEEATAKETVEEKPEA